MSIAKFLKAVFASSAALLASPSRALDSTAVSRGKDAKEVPSVCLLSWTELHFPCALVCSSGEPLKLMWIIFNELNHYICNYIYICRLWFQKRLRIDLYIKTIWYLKPNQTMWRRQALWLSRIQFRKHVLLSNGIIK